MTLSHFTAEPLAFDRSRTYVQDPEMFKPRGFWVSVDGEDDWPSWCRSEGFAVDRLDNRSIVTIREDANILTLRTAEEVDALPTRYPSPILSRWVDWTAVVNEYDGILIPVYQWRARLSSIWYYPWDCASGCIWNLDAIDAVTTAEAVLS